MRVFNLAEELEKERKKNKALQEDVNKYVCQYRYVKMEKENLQDRIDKAIEIINKKKMICEATKNYIYPLSNNDIKELLNILQGDNK